MKNGELLDLVVELLENGGASTDDENKKLAGLIQDVRNSQSADAQLRREVKARLKNAQPEDFDVIAVGKSKEQKDRIKNIRDIIRELEREAGSAHIDIIIERAAKLGFDKDKVEAEIAHLVQEQTIFEPVRYSQNYRLTSQ